MSVAVRNELEGSLKGLAEHLEQQQDVEQADKVKDLLERSTTEELFIAMCGHFSAGKSTLINTLAGEPLLPSSPIPTSANLVVIRYGERGATIRYRNGKQASVSMDELEQYCKNGEDIEQVLITAPSPLLRNGLCLLDTPGVDSTDPAHAQSTQSAIHLADVVLFVTDYNHVQSEQNFMFLKQLSDWEKPCVVVVNQVDKHREEELAFTAFQREVNQSLEQWELHPAGVLYVSAKNENAPHNEWHSLLKLLQQCAQQVEQLRLHTLTRSVRGIIRQHMQEMQRRTEQRKQELSLDAETIEQWLQRKDELEQELHDIEQSQSSWLRDRQEEMTKLLGNANIIPAVTRDRMHAVIESRQTNFKAGWLFAGAKTEKERENRLNALFNDFSEQIRVHLDKHVQDTLNRWMEEAGWNDQEWKEALQAVSFPLTPEWLVQQIQPGALATGEYTMTYANSVSDKVKQHVRREVFQLLDRMGKRHTEEAEPVKKELLHALEEARSQLQAKEQSDRWDRELREEEARLYQAWPLPGESVEHLMTSWLNEERKSIKANDRAEGEQVPSAASESNGSSSQARSSIGTASSETIPSFKSDILQVKDRGNSAIAQRMLKAAKRLGSFPGFEPKRKHLQEKAIRMQNRQFTVALFGAFSAGKSSFINALLGEPLLPVSPAPTTAAVNRVMMPPEEAGHKQARVVFKSSQQIEEELLRSLTLLGENASGTEEALRIIRSLELTDIPPKAKMNYSFLRAAEKGWNEQSVYLGQERLVDYDQYIQYAATESYSCFVDYIELYYESPLTKAGLVLVDTPGADSINARHTGVAYHYLKNADAVIFVTYYNHAFSLADRDFLKQMSQVKSRDELNHLFFVLNAADLAGDEEELQQVQDYVRNQLQSSEIVSPRLFPVSSRMAVQGKVETSSELYNASGLEAFEASFYRFVFEDLAALAVESGRKELKELTESLNVFAAEAQGDRHQRLEELKKLKERTELLKQKTAEWSDTFSRDSIDNELGELMYYIRQRCMYRYHERFAASFNPAVLNQQTKDNRQMLWICWQDLLQELSTYFTREMQTLGSRMERFLTDLAQKETNKLLAVLDPGSRKLAEREHVAVELQVFEQVIELRDESVDPKKLVSYYKNPKSFFEGTGRDEMKTQLEPAVSALLEQHGSEWETVLAEKYQEKLIQAVESAANETVSSLQHYSSGLEHTFAQDGMLPQILRFIEEIEEWLEV
ncbi:dynamin family protein [Marinicrinis lubricantis]|uniref:Dynamin family protein n=1 Tax=Marinicrinis lubricantis TaxID=2086470 RepID=A0ABW1ILT8_9BACL